MPPRYAYETREMKELKELNGQRTAVYAKDAIEGKEYYCGLSQCHIEAKVVFSKGRFKVKYGDSKNHSNQCRRLTKFKIENFDESSFNFEKQMRALAGREIMFLKNSRHNCDELYSDPEVIHDLEAIEDIFRNEKEDMTGWGLSEIPIAGCYYFENVKKDEISFSNSFRDDGGMVPSYVDLEHIEREAISIKESFIKNALFERTWNKNMEQEQ